MVDEESPRLPADAPHLPDVGRVDAWWSMAERAWGLLGLLGGTSALAQWWKKLMTNINPDVYIGGVVVFFIGTCLLGALRHHVSNKRAQALETYRQQLESWAAKRVAAADAAVAAVRAEEQEKARVLRVQDGLAVTNKESQLQAAYVQWESRIAEKDREIAELKRQGAQKTETIAKLSRRKAPPKPKDQRSAQE